MEYKNPFELVASEFQQAGIPFVLIGGFAVNYYKVMRNTQDVDFLLPEEESTKGVKVLENSGYHVDESREIFVRLVNDRLRPARVDLMLVSNDTFDKISDKGKKARIGGHDFIVPTIEHLIALKLHAMKNNPNREWKDLTDVLGLIKMNQIDVSSKEFRETCLKFGTEGLYHRIMEFFKKP